MATTTTQSHYPSPVEVRSKDIGKEAFEELMRLFQNMVENKATVVRNFLKEHDLDKETVPCYEKHYKWAVAYGRNGGGRNSGGNEMGYYFLANFKDTDSKALRQRPYPVFASHVYSIGEMATIFNIQLESTG